MVLLNVINDGYINNKLKELEMWQCHQNIFNTVSNPINPCGESGTCLVTVKNTGHNGSADRFYTGITDMQFLESGNTIRDYFEWMEEEINVFLFNCEFPIWFMKIKQIYDITPLNKVIDEYKKETGLEKINYNLNEFIKRCLSIETEREYPRHYKYENLFRDYLKELNPKFTQDEA